MTLQDIPGSDVIGWSYDVFGQYASAESAIRRLFDFGEKAEIRTDEKHVYQIPRVLEPLWASERRSKYLSYSGTTIEKYGTDLATKTGVAGTYGAFSASLEVDFHTTSFRVSTMAFTKIVHLITTWILRLPDLDELRELLLPRVKEEIDGGLEPSLLFDKYGTHFLSNVIVGARAEYSSATNMERFTSTTSLDIVARASYESIAGSLSAEHKTSYQQDIETFRSASRTILTTIGGKGELAVPGKWGDWRESVDDRPEFVYFGTSSNPGLVPIWELCADKARRVDLKEAFTSCLEKQGTTPGADLYPVYQATADKPVRFAYSLNPDAVAAHGIDWQHGSPVFYAFKDPAEGTAPIYEAFATNPWRFAYSTNPDPVAAHGVGWQKSNEGDPVFHAFRFSGEQPDGTVKIYEQPEGTVEIYEAWAEDPRRLGYSTNPVGSAAHGEGWVCHGPAFYAFPLL
jgi:hypothetical protein